ncbi:conserved hypothetical protein [Rhodopseudomonas palustris BisB5]|uniref:Uncharacterized protein n=1 Tax=Rhodopseudomonas palustris (strain BisB5) TaxID=316057 RepID=Q138B8_RHOPS|nr:conserved hypothetical protein [Rhodopseudomonas palustris BisB5]
MQEIDALSAIHKTLISFNKRAERSSNELLVATFVDSAPLYDLLSTTNNQVIYGRRGTGKTHALKFLSENVTKQGDLAIYLDLRGIGSNGSIYSDSSKTLSERASVLVVDVLSAVHDELFQVAIAQIDSAINPEQITLRVDDLAKSITTVAIGGPAETVEKVKNEISSSAGAIAGGELSQTSKVSGKLSSEVVQRESRDHAIKRSGPERIRLNFGSVMSALSGLLEVLGQRRVWLLIDEWSEIPVDLQPYLADLLRRTVLPVGRITVKIAAIEHRSNFAILEDRGEYVGIELGADLSADLNLDDFLVFENNQQKSTNFFKSLFFRHYTTSDDALPEIDTAEKLIQTVFTQFPVFEEFVRAVEGVPRDALNLAAKIATKAFGQKVAVQHVRGAARDWYQQDKASVIRSNEKLATLLNNVIDEVIGNRKARAFLISSSARDARIDQLFDSRLLHILKKNISSNDEPGARYDVYKIDYGCYVDLINTAKMPAGLFLIEEDGKEHFVEVPRDDYRSIRRAILRI